MPVTTTGGANFSLEEEELNSQEKTQGPHFSEISLSPPSDERLATLPWTPRKQFGPVDSCLSQHGAQISLKNTLKWEASAFRIRNFKAVKLSDASYQTALYSIISYCKLARFI